MTNTITPQHMEICKILRELDEDTYLQLQTCVTLFVSAGSRVTKNLSMVWEIKMGDMLDAFSICNKETGWDFTQL